jgi:EPS-associated MarR family transcriptional regulator
MLDETTHYHLLKLLQDNPELSQRALAEAAGISLGKVNYCLKALIEKGLIKAANFRNNPNKKAYAYLLTAKGIEEKARITVRFLRRKQQEYEELRSEIEHLRQEVSRLNTDTAFDLEKEADEAGKQPA